MDLTLQPVAESRLVDGALVTTPALAPTGTEPLLESLLCRARVQSTSYRAWCVACQAPRDLIIDLEWGGSREGARWRPNWRERLECPVCRLNNRMRLSLQLLRQAAFEQRPGTARVYCMEQVTPFFQSAGNLDDLELIGSEYLGPGISSGTTNPGGITHQDACHTSFADASFDIIVSNDVFEHIPEPDVGFRESHRILKSHGTLIATFPWNPALPHCRSRAKLKPDSGAIEHLEKPLYHGNPLSSKGSLVFTDFSSRVLHTIQEAGFSDVRVYWYRSEVFGHLGGYQSVFMASA
ncbi:methyltransferase domain-containing protein [Vulcanococcus limneticus]|uniref:methyltransferase domain-containing protein n=1 Tax=Vulcanococcus limneticus TaxID=2170428 RepID=UPI00398BD90B